MPDWIAGHEIELAGFTLTLLVTIIGWITEHRSAKADDEKRRDDIERVNKQVAVLEKQANEAAERNRVARAALDVSQQQLEVMRSRLEIERETSARQPVEPPYVPPWRLSWVKGDTYALTNGGADTEYDVQVTPPEYSAAPLPMRFESIGPMSSVTFLIALTIASPNRNVTVTWRHGDEAEHRSWTGVLPTR